MTALAAAGVRAGAAATAKAVAGIAARLAAEAPEVSVSVGEGLVTVSAPGLVARVFGSRQRGSDPRLSALMGGSR
ncbi:MAG: hypothetical protein H7267_00955 [Sandarakinorhabdus sp.]|nr:hypothetical protein [Sandarakinorhabdus sp.]